MKDFKYSGFVLLKYLKISDSIKYLYIDFLLEIQYLFLKMRN
jgi:hypothetical protein